MITLVIEGQLLTPMGLARVRMTRDPSFRVRDIDVDHEVEAPWTETELKFLVA